MGICAGMLTHSLLPLNDKGAAVQPRQFGNEAIAFAAFSFPILYWPAILSVYITLCVCINPLGFFFLSKRMLFSGKIFTATAAWDARISSWDLLHVKQVLCP